MARTINASRLAEAIRQLQQERQSLQSRIDQIDRIFAQCGISIPAAAPRGTAMAARREGGRQRAGRKGRFPTSANQSLLDLIGKAGKGGIGSGQIVKHWKSEGRAGQPYVVLRYLVKQGKLKKKSVKGPRDSQYTIA